MISVALTNEMLARIISIEKHAPVDMARALSVSNRTVINWSAKLAENGLVEPQLAREQVRSYKVIGA